MAHSEEVVRVHLVIWIRKALHRAVKLYCLNHETAVMEFVIEAIQEKLATSTGSWSGSPPMVEGVSTAPPKAYELIHRRMEQTKAHTQKSGPLLRPRISSHFSQSSASP